MVRIAGGIHRAAIKVLLGDAIECYYHNYRSH